MIIKGRGDLATLNSQSQILFLIFSFTKSSPYLFFYIDNFGENVNNTAAIVVITVLLLVDLNQLHEPALEYASRAGS